MTNDNNALNKSKNSSYRSPQLFVVGTAIELICQHPSGQLKDGAGGWWVKGS